jgi:hypothetical protein
MTHERQLQSGIAALPVVPMRRRRELKTTPFAVV